MRCSSIRLLREVKPRSIGSPGARLRCVANIDTAKIWKTILNIGFCYHTYYLVVIDLNETRPNTLLASTLPFSVDNDGDDETWLESGSEMDAADEVRSFFSLFAFERRMREALLLAQRGKMHM